MAPIGSATLQDKQGHVRLLLTGFGAFGGIIDNPSTLAGRLLDGQVLEGLPLPKHPREDVHLAVSTLGDRKDHAGSDAVAGDLSELISASVDISRVTASALSPENTRRVTPPGKTAGSSFAPTIPSIRPHPAPCTSTPTSITFQPVAVTYEEVGRRVPAWHKSGEWDAIVHVGVAAGYTGVAIESGSNRLGYNMKFPDADGKFPPTVTGGNGIEGTADRWYTIVNTQQLLEQQKGALGFEHTFISDDPGGYLCGYMCAMSLKWSIIVAEYEQRTQIPVIFIHVPAAADDPMVPGPYTIEQLADYLRGVCWFMGQQGAKVKYENDGDI